MDIQKTTDYKQFKGIIGNRGINQVHYANLAKSILSNNLLAANPIIVNKNMEVIDGQHRLKIAEENSLPIFYVVIDHGGIEEIQKLNANAKPWTMQDYIDSYVALGNQDYVMLDEFAKHYKISPSIAALLIGGDERYESTLGVRSMYAGIRHGLFKVRLLEQGTHVVEILMALKPFLENRGLMNNAAFVRAIRKIYVYDEKLPNKLIYKLNVSGIQLKRETTTREYMRQFEDVLNFKTQEQNHVRLY